MRVINVAAAQMRPIQRADSRQVVVKRMLALMDEAKAGGADLIVYPELALTTFSDRPFHVGRTKPGQPVLRDRRSKWVPVPAGRRNRIEMTGEGEGVMRFRDQRRRCLS
jgi:hypothetical protein